MFALFALAQFDHPSAHAAQTCKQVRFSDVGWTDISASTAVASLILESLGYDTRITQLSIPVTYRSLKNRDIDVFLGNWMPSMAADIQPYQANHSVETIGAVLKGARYTLAVPHYVFEAGVDSVTKLAQFQDRFQRKIYGIEPGNDGNRLIQKMISENAFHLRDWSLIESSEQAMLMEVKNAIKSKRWVAFLGWEPHPMNTQIKITYLNGADHYFGPKQGESTVFINTRKGYDTDCPEVTRFLKNFSLTVKIENALMEMILVKKMEPRAAALSWMKSHPDIVKSWLKGVRSLSNKDGYSVVLEKLSNMEKHENG